MPDSRPEMQAPQEMTHSFESREILRKFDELKETVLDFKNVVTARLDGLSALNRTHTEELIRLTIHLDDLATDLTITRSAADLSRAISLRIEQRLNDIDYLKSQENGHDRVTPVPNEDA